MHRFTRPRALGPGELAGLPGQFRAAAVRALAAGFDGVEIHAGNGYLLDQFLRDGANHRGDSYGGSPANRARLLREVTAAVLSVWGAGAVIAAGGHTADTGTARIRRNEADLIAYGQLFIANPDLPARFARNAPLAQPQRATFFGGAEGYTGYPSLNGLRRDRG